MTQNQRTQLRKVINNLYNVQVTLNAIMYLEPIADIEYETNKRFLFANL